jgi:hypothetical protein
LIPDFIPILGYLDDLIIVPVGIWCMYKLTPPHVIEECQLQAEGMDKKSKRNWTNYLITLLIILLYLFIFWWLYEKIQPFMMDFLYASSSTSPIQIMEPPSLPN